MTDTTKDPLARWWWPGQWLHIVWGVWVDQVWYWQTVRPRLHGRKQGWGLFLQSLLGATIVTVLFLLPIVGLLGAAGSAIRWEAALGLGEGFVPVIVFSTAFSLVVGLGEGIPYNPTLIPPIVIAGFVWEQCRYPNGYFGSWVVLLLFYIVISFAAGISVGVSKGRVGLKDALPLPVFLAFGLTNFASNLEEFKSIIPCVIVPITAFLFGLFWLYLGGQWATRRLDDETRKRLANPDAHPSKS